MEGSLNGGKLECEIEVKIVFEKKEVTLESLLLSHPGILHSRWTDGESS